MLRVVPIRLRGHSMRSYRRLLSIDIYDLKWFSATGTTYLSKWIGHMFFLSTQTKKTLSKVEHNITTDTHTHEQKTSTLSGSSFYWIIRQHYWGCSFSNCIANFQQFFVGNLGHHLNISACICTQRSCTNKFWWSGEFCRSFFTAIRTVRRLFGLSCIFIRCGSLWRTLCLNRGDLLISWYKPSIFMFHILTLCHYLLRLMVLKKRWNSLLDLSRRGW